MDNNEMVELYPTQSNVGVDMLTPTKFRKSLALRLINTNKWAYTPTPATGKDLELMVAKAQSELDEKLKEIANREAEIAQREKEVEVKLNKKTSKEV